MLGESNRLAFEKSKYGIQAPMETHALATGR